MSSTGNFKIIKADFSWTWFLFGAILLNIFIQ